MVDECVPLIVIVFGFAVFPCLVLLPDKLAELKQDWRRERERKKLMKETYKKYKGLWIPQGAEDRGFQRFNCISGGNYYNCGADRRLFDEVSDALERSLAREKRHQDCPECRGCGYIGQEPRQRCPSCDGYGVQRKFRTYIW